MISLGQILHSGFVSYKDYKEVLFCRKLFLAAFCWLALCVSDIQIFDSFQFSSPLREALTAKISWNWLPSDVEYEAIVESNHQIKFCWPSLTWDIEAWGHLFWFRNFLNQHGSLSGWETKRGPFSSLLQKAFVPPRTHYQGWTIRRNEYELSESQDMWRGFMNFTDRISGQ